MKATNTLLATLVALSLTACGGGGSSGDGGSANASSTTEAPLSLAEYEGVWKSTSSKCEPKFAYNPAYFYQFRDLTVTAEKGNFHIAVNVLVYDDAACTVARGLQMDTVFVIPQKTALEGRDNAFKGSGVWIGAFSTHAAGVQMLLTKLPDGSISELVGNKFLADVKDGRWYITLAKGAVPVDGTGYPIQIDTSEYLVR